MKRIGLIILLLISIQTLSFGGRFKHISTHNGLSNKRTFSIVKDNKGFMWISTKVGIDRFDGSKVKHYLLSDSTGMLDLTGRINILEKDKLGNLWAYTNYGQIFKYNEMSDSYILVLNLLNYFQSDKIPFLINIVFTDKNQLLISGSFGIYIYNLERKTLNFIDEFKDVYISLLDQIDKSSYFISSDKGTFITNFDFQNFILSKKHTTKIPINERIRVIYPDKVNSLLYIGTATGKLIQYNIKNSTSEYLDYNFKTSIRDIKYHDNILYIATDGAGLISINSKTKQVEETYVNSVLQDSRVTSLAFYNILIDDNRLWIATYSNGIYLIDGNIPYFNKIPYHPSYNYTSPNSLNSFLEDTDGNYWFGTNDGVFRFDNKSKKWDHLLKSDVSNNVTRYNALTLCEDNLGTIWVGGASFGLISRINKRTLQVSNNYIFNEDPNKIENRHVYSIYKDSEGFIWLGGLRGLLTRYNPITDEIKRYNIMSVNSIVESNNLMLIGTVRGLFLLNKNDNTFEKMLTVETTKSTMLSFINCIYTDKQGIIWLGTEGGLIKYDMESNEVKYYTKEIGFLTNSIFAILADARNRLWLSSEKGLICFNALNETLNYFGIEEGLNDERFLPRGAFQQQNGELVFLSSNSAISFVGEKIDRLKIKNNLMLTDFSINNKSIYPTSENSPLTLPINQTDKIILKHNDNTFSLGFTNINYTNPNRTRFEWKLIGYDKNWVKGLEYANYANVPPGEYKFNLLLLDIDNNHQILSKKVRIIIKPIIWATVWAKIFYLVVLLVLIWLLIQFIKERLDRRNTNDKINFFTYTAHELKTPISLINAPLKKIQKQENLTDDGNALLNLAVKNSERLNQMVLQLLDFQKTEIISTNFVVFEVKLKQYILERIETIKELAKQKNIDVSIIDKSDGVYVWINKDYMDIIFNNLLTNALKYTPMNGQISINTYVNQNRWIVEIRDSGIGISSKIQRKIFNPFYRAENVINSTETGSGIGLQIVKNSIKKHSGVISLDSIEGVGSVFKISFPLGYNHYKKSKTVFKSKENTNNLTLIKAINNDKPNIIIVEDNNELRLFLKQCLIEKYTVYEAINGSEGIRLTRNVNPELIISDIMMPGMDGYELCKQIKNNKETSHIPIILLTALDDKSNMLKGYELGADNYITKPFDIDILKLTIENTIETRQSLRRNLMLPLENIIQDEKELNTNSFDKAFLDEVIAIIDHNISNNEYSINELCREIAMSRTSFYNKLKAITNQSPNSFIRLIRLNRASKLLIDGNEPVAEIAVKTGFGDAKYFSTIFKKQFGLSPTDYRKINKEQL